MVVEKPPKWIQGLHEFVSVCAATGYGLASGQAGVSLIDRSVGTQNAVGAFYAAFLNSAPLVVFASANEPGVPIPTGLPPLHFSRFQNLMVEPWVKWSTLVHSLETLPDDVDKAFHLALSEHQAPVFVTLRQDIMAQTIEKGRLEVNQAPLLSSRIPDVSVLNRIIDDITSHQNPQILVSHLGRHPQAVQGLIEFAKLFGIAVTDRRFFVNYPISEPLHSGFLARYGSPELLSHTDLVLALEIGFLPHQRFPGNVDAVDLGSDPLHRQDVYAGGEYGSSLFPARIRAACDVGPTLDELIHIGKRRLTRRQREQISDRSSMITANHKKMRAEWREKAKRSYESGKLDPWSVGYVLNRHWSGEMSWVNGSPSGSDGLFKTVEIERPGTYFGNPSGHLGAVLGMAYGIAMASRRYADIRNMGSYKTGRITPTERVVVCTTGDGDAIFGNIDSALWTCSHYGIGVVYIILNNACWGVEWPPIERSPMHWAAKANDFEFIDLDRPRIDFAKIARAFKVSAETLDTPDGFDSALVRAVRLARKGRPVLLDLRQEKYSGPSASVVQ
jgi:acetolactate synthase-1/2/3 large subunit